jgi:hypothetical protein
MPRALPIATTLEPCVVFLRVGDQIRIGRTSYLRRYLLEVRAGCEPKPELLGYVHEARFPDHDLKQFIRAQWAIDHLDSDWFRASPALLSWIDEVRERPELRR